MTNSAACRLIESYVAGVSNDAFFEDTEKQDAPSLPFRQMRGMRNIVAHDYGHVDVALVWKAAIENIPAIRRALADFLGEKR